MCAAAPSLWCRQNVERTQPVVFLSLSLRTARSLSRLQNVKHKPKPEKRTVIKKMKCKEKKRTYKKPNDSVILCMQSKELNDTIEQTNEIIFHTKTPATAPAALAVEAHITTRTMSKNGNSIETRHKNLFSSNTTSPHSSSTSSVVCACVA